MIYRLKKNFEFKIVYRRGKSVANEILVMYMFKNKKNKDGENNPYNRLGVSVSKKVGNSVVRSRSKRLISESFRLNYKYIIKGYDFIFKLKRVRLKIDKDIDLYINEETTNKSN